MAQQPKRTNDQIVDKLVSDPTSPPRVALLSGFVGTAGESGHTRIYLDPELSAWVDVPDDAILNRQPIPESVSPLGGSYVWIARDAEVAPGPAAPDVSRGRFFEGPVAAEYQQQFGLQPEGVPTFWPCTVWNCPPSTRDASCSTFACPTSPVACHTRQVQCPTALTCQTNVACPTRVGCNTAGFQCPGPHAEAERGIPTAWPCTLWACPTPHAPCPPQTSTPGCVPQTFAPPCPPRTFGPPCPRPTQPGVCPTYPGQCQTVVEPHCYHPTRPAGCTPLEAEWFSPPTTTPATC